jgi:hypothetical protein
LGAALNVVAAPPVTNNMALIPAGPFTMGDSFNDGNSSELPLHKIYVSAFYRDRCFVTKAFWDSVYLWATNHGYSFDNAGSGKAPNQPVETVNIFRGTFEFSCAFCCQSLARRFSASQHHDICALADHFLDDRFTDARGPGQHDANVISQFERRRFHLAEKINGICGIPRPPIHKQSFFESQPGIGAKKK